MWFSAPEKPRLERDPSTSECLGNGAPLLCGLRLLLEFFLTDAWYFGLGFKVYMRDFEPFSGPFDMRLGGRVNPVGREAGLAEHKSKRHRKAARMCRRDQLFGTGTFLVLEARLEGIATL